MDLYLSHGAFLCPKNTVLRDSTGKPIYLISTPGIIHKTTTIYKIPAGACTEFSDKEKLKEVKRLKNEVDCGLEEKARIHWRVFNSSRLVYNGQIREMKDFMPRVGFSCRNRTFLGPDGLSYRWHMGHSASQLFLNDGSNPRKMVAKMYPRNIFTGKKARLEIDAAGLHILETIVITWVYVETLRRKKHD